METTDHIDSAEIKKIKELSVDARQCMEILVERCKTAGIVLSEIQLRQFGKYFDLLTEKAQHGRGEWDMIILDPPAFTKSRRNVEGATRGYKDINLRAMRLLPRGGWLATASCSHFMTRELFEKMLASAARDAGVSLRLVERRGQAPDHPVLWGVPETEYLKFYLFQVV